LVTVKDLKEGDRVKVYRHMSDGTLIKLLEHGRALVKVDRTGKEVIEWISDIDKKL